MTIRRRASAGAVAFFFLLATGALVSAGELPPEAADAARAVAQQEADDEAERLEDEAEDAAEAAEDAAEDEADRLEDEAEAAEDAAEREAEAAEDAADDCASEPEGTHGKAVCEAAQAWKAAGADAPPANQGEIVSGVAQQNHGADIAAQKEANGGKPDAAMDALANAGPNGDGPPGLRNGGDDDDEDEEEEGEEDVEEEEEEEEDEEAP